MIPSRLMCVDLSFPISRRPFIHNILITSHYIIILSVFSIKVFASTKYPWVSNKTDNSNNGFLISFNRDL